MDAMSMNCPLPLIPSPHQGDGRKPGGVSSLISKETALAYKILTAEFIKSAAQPKQFLSPEVSEIAFTGRSNVGKSGLLNVLVNRKGIAKTSKTPGKTRLVNFFDVRLESHHIRLVDLPGYGYAKVKGEMRKEWSSLIDSYIAHRPNLRLVCSLVDCRHDASRSMFSFWNGSGTVRFPT